MRFTSLQFIAFYSTCFIAKNGNGVSAHPGCTSMPDQDGDCDSHVDEWYFSKRDRKCMPFMYGDCPQGGNEFKTEKDCMDTCLNAVKETGGPAKGSKGHRKPQRPRDSSEETIGAGGRRPVKGGSEEEGNENESVKPPKPARPSGRPNTKPQRVPKWKEPAGKRKRPQPPKQKRPGKADCGVRAKWVDCNQDYTGKWFFVGQFGTCSPVKPGQCPTHGSFFETCEQCMHKCHRAWKHKCERMQRKYQK
uniref:Putative monolaris n=1 Tax=Rhipicephalus pulchellus TaxID=72859 RepID=L7LSI4_RHIPC